ncbi:MAG TPA: hypothetical protein VHS26_04180, partial [Solirubrobacteraceae bacterium]|nr:hypothetical protein [Solirubrobacteraceae bacterium]
AAQAAAGQPPGSQYPGRPVAPPSRAPQQRPTAAQQRPPLPPPDLSAPRRVSPPMRSTDVPAWPAAQGERLPVRSTLAVAFADPAHARSAVILAEVLGPPVALRPQLHGSGARFTR